RYAARIDAVRQAEQRVAPGSTALTEAAARNLFKLMAYKDEYEVARLYADDAFRKALEQQFEGDFRIEFNLAPPLLARMDPRTGRPRKMRFGSWMMPVFRILARLRRLRGTPFDIFGYHAERRMERALIVEYEELLGLIARGLSARNLDTAVALARLPERIRGYGPVKRANVAEARARQAELLARFTEPGPAERTAA
ncbi:MAG TPA: DUF6537 domain-containing protein, partial [Sphingomonadales bacterium]